MKNIPPLFEDFQYRQTLNSQVVPLLAEMNQKDTHPLIIGPLPNPPSILLKMHGIDELKFAVAANPSEVRHHQAELKNHLFGQLCLRVQFLGYLLRVKTYRAPRIEFQHFLHFQLHLAL